MNRMLVAEELVRIARRVISSDVIPFNPEKVMGRIIRNEFIGPTWYVNTLNKIWKALDGGRKVEILAVERSDYGVKLEAVVDGKTLPLTRGKVRENNLDYWFK